MKELNSLKYQIRSLIERNSFIIICKDKGRYRSLIQDEITTNNGKVIGYISTQKVVDKRDSEWIIDARDENFYYNLNNYLSDPPIEFLSWLNKIDPQKKAIIVGTPWTNIPSVAGRRMLGFRESHLDKIEDKVWIDSFLKKHELASPRSTIVKSENIVRFYKTCDGYFENSVVSGEFRNESSSGGKDLFYKTKGCLPKERLVSYARNFRNLRVSEYVLGTPVSIIGMVFNRYVAAFRPIEIITLFNKTSNSILFSGSTTYHCLSERNINELTLHCKKIGEILKKDFGYRGIFSIDGVYSNELFKVTEINPRHASGLGVKSSSSSFPFYLFNRLVQSHKGIEWKATIDSLEKSINREMIDHGNISAVIPNNDHHFFTPSELASAASSLGLPCRFNTTSKQFEVAYFNEYKPDSASNLVCHIANSLSRSDTFHTSLA